MKNIGKFCKVINAGDTYYLYTTFAQTYNLRKFKKYDLPEYDKTYKIILIEKHLEDDNYLYGIEDEKGNQFIMDECGIEIIEGNDK